MCTEEIHQILIQEENAINCIFVVSRFRIQVSLGDISAVVI